MINQFWYVITYKMAPNIKRLSKQSRNTKSIFVFFVGLEKLKRLSATVYYWKVLMKEKLENEQS